MSYEKRLKIIGDEGRYFRCLKLGHRAAARRVEPNCYNGHHTSKHVLISPSKPAKANINSVNTEIPHNFVGFVPVTILGPKGSKETHAFLFNGSDSTLLSSAAANSLRIVSPLTRLIGTTVAGKASQATSEVNFSVHSLSGDNQLQIKRAYTLKILPTQTAHIPSGLDSWLHLKNGHFEEIKDKTVDLSVGANTTEAHRIQNQHIITTIIVYFRCARSMLECMIR
ncbi:hypothetical protein FGIG_11341 [Fasciola gigantica]|uniref:Uncharacterized protein n=1 Tax=Fasciola gigantica TaxID=46835 RepID=A0A504YLV8_FASGI|nr:hypothetical protein FGIG_11341 [Fasciola gigantica]